jgi:hypothetical protein
MRNCLRLLLVLSCLGTAHALTPLLDNSPGFFAGEWAGTGAQGSYCYLKLSADGWGWVLIDGGSGDWLVAQMKWRNQRQALQIEKIIPLPASPQLRVMPLEKFVLDSTFNQSLKLTWSTHSGDCQMQKIETTAAHLLRARSAVAGLQSAEGSR